MISLITLAGNTVSCVTMPTCPGFESVQWSYSDAVASVTSIFTGQVQTQQWPGADMWAGTLTLPTLEPHQADEWTASLLQLRGMANAFQLVDPMKQHPRGNASGSPIVDGSFAVAAGGQTLYTKGWTNSTPNLLLRNDHFQIGYRLYKGLDPVSSDANGAAAISIWPSLREAPTAGTPLILNNPSGLFRLATNKRVTSVDFTSLYKISFPIVEYR